MPERSVRRIKPKEIKKKEKLSSLYSFWQRLFSWFRGILWRVLFEQKSLS